MPLDMPPPPNKEDLLDTWKYLEAGINGIMTNLQEGVDMKTYMGLYSAVHNFCTSQKAVSSSVNGHQVVGPNMHRGAHLLGEELYKNLILYLKQHLEQVREKSQHHFDEGLLSFYISEWNRYTTAATYINHLFRYLNRHWVKREMDEGKKSTYDVYTLHLVQWRKELFMHVQSQVMKAVLNLVEKQRNGETIEQSQIKSIVDSFVSLGLDESDSTKTTLDVYRYHFENPFIEATRLYYKKESHDFVAENNVVEYMKKAETRLAEEKERVGMYLHSDILTLLEKTCLTVLVSDHLKLFHEEFQSLLDNNREEDLARMYKLLKRVDNGLDVLRVKFEAHVRKAGFAAVSKVASQGDSLDPKVYVDALLSVHSQYAAMVNVAFDGEGEFVRSLDNACREFVNRNELCKANTNKSPELLAKYADSLLKRGAKQVEESEMEELLNQIMTIFKYIEDKDVFQKFYSRQFAKRLVHSSSASEDIETTMISKLKEACGYEYTNKLQRMFQDIQVSKELNSKHQDWLQKTYDDEDQKKGVDATFQILGTGFWPLNSPSTSLVPPPEIVRTYERFQKFYDDQHSGRKLTWLWHLCRGDLKANYIKNSRTPYTFSVSTYQMAILCLFNDAENLQYQHIKEATQLAPEVLDPTLALLLKTKVLLADSDDRKPDSDTTYSLNYSYKSKKVKVNLNFAIKSEQKQEIEDTHKNIEEDRKMLMQSAIVRIMKSRKQMKHAQLVSETINQIKSRFTPNPKDIKKCIDILLEKEYLERKDNDELGYLA
ncbi:MAG: hypothetical protein M1834_007358 [Cirrosporium novae-zelandiae]|nr:MAG: hypothetical protein M1834_007358 [Cirrosporium novae-zelandiae]